MNKTLKQGLGEEFVNWLQTKYAKELDEFYKEAMCQFINCHIGPCHGGTRRVILKVLQEHIQV